MNDLNRSIKIFIDGSEASAGVKKIEDAIFQLEKSLLLIKRKQGTLVNPRSYKKSLKLNTKHLTPTSKKLLRLTGS